MPIFNFDFLPRIEVSVHLYFLIIFTICIAPILAIITLNVSSARACAISPRGCRKLGLRIQSNLHDEFHPRNSNSHGLGTSVDSTDGWKIKSLWIFPVKSCRGVELHRGSVIDTGMQYDRLFSFAQAKRGVQSSQLDPPAAKWTFLTQRQHPLLARVKTEIWVPDPSSPTYSERAADVRSGGVIIISFPQASSSDSGLMATLESFLPGRAKETSFRIPFSPTTEMCKKGGYTVERMTIWKDSPESLNMSRHVPPELAQFLGIKTELGLFRVLQGKEREVHRCAPKKQDIGWQPIAGFTDAYPLHLMNLASVRDVGSRLPRNAPRLGALRFRANIIVTGPPAYAEDGWKRIRIASSEFYVVCRTARCRLPNTDPDTGVKHKDEPDKTLRSFRCIDEGSKEYASLGMQMVPDKNSVGIITVGDTIEVLETGGHRYIRQ